MHFSFVDEVVLEVKAGNGGEGINTFRQERGQLWGGPDGGHGGKGGDVLFLSQGRLNTLFHFRGEKVLRARDGEPGGRNQRKGAEGKELVLKVPVGTLLYDVKNDRLIADLAEEGQSIIVARGGRGGRGNARFATPSRKAPRLRELGAPGESLRVRLELRLLADVGLVGLPNAGKSTLLSRISHARPKVADYPFTTLSPVLGVVETEEGGFVVADLPGLIEGASTGAGLGHDFLRHVGRARSLVYVVDASSQNPRHDFRTVREEILAFSPHLEHLEQVIALNKIDLMDTGTIHDTVADLEKEGLKVFPVSALTGQDLDHLVAHLSHLTEGSVRVQGKGTEYEGTPAIYHKPVVPLTVKAQVASADSGQDAFVVTGTRVERWAAMADLEEEEGVEYLHRKLTAAGVIKRLEELGAKEGDTVAIGATEFTFVPEKHFRPRDARPSRVRR